MKRGQSNIPKQWLVLDHRREKESLAAIPRLPRRTGVLVLMHQLKLGERKRLFRDLRRIAARRGLVVLDGTAGDAARVHDRGELRRALTSGARILLLSPMFATRSHPEWARLPRMRASTLARMAPRPVIALGGMSEQRFRRIERIGFAGWAGIDAWLA